MSCAKRISHDIHFAWQVQYSVKLDNGTCCFAHWKSRFKCDKDQSQVSLFVAGAVFGDVGVSFFVAGAVLGEIWKDSRSTKCCIFP